MQTRLPCWPQRSSSLLVGDDDRGNRSRAAPRCRADTCAAATPRAAWGTPWRPALTAGRRRGRRAAGRAGRREPAPMDGRRRRRAARGGGLRRRPRRGPAKQRRRQSPPGQPSPRRACRRQSSGKPAAGEEPGIAGGDRHESGTAVARAAGSWPSSGASSAARWRRRSRSRGRAARSAIGDRSLFRFARLALPGLPDPRPDGAAPAGLGGRPPHQRGDRLRPGGDPPVRSEPVPLSVPGAVGRSRASRCRPRPTSRACAATSPTAASC